MEFHGVPWKIFHGIPWGYFTRVRSEKEELMLETHTVYISDLSLRAQCT